MMRPALFVCALAAPLPALADAAVSPGATAFEVGYFCAREAEELAEAAGTIAGVVNLVRGVPPFVATGTTVPAQLGVGFGVHITIDPAYAGLVDLTITHPPMGPEGITRQTWTTELVPGDPDYLGYSFDREYELRPGDWTFTAEAQGRLVYRVDFTVVRAGLMPPVPCGPPALS